MVKKTGASQLCLSTPGVETQKLTAAMEIEFHESHGRVDPVVIWIVIAMKPNPGEVGLVEVSFEGLQPMLQYRCRIVLVICSEEIDDKLLLLSRE